MEQDRQNQAKIFAKQKRLVFFYDFSLHGLWAILWVITGFSIFIRDQLFTFGLPILVINAIFIVLYGLSSIIILFPLTWYGDFLLPKRFEVSNETLASWLLDQVKGTLISGILGIPVLMAIYWFLSTQPRTWWIWAASFMVFLSVLFARLYPVLIAPIFNKFIPLGTEYESLSNKLSALAEKAQTHISGVYQFDQSRRSKTANAALMGLSKSKRIVLSDTMLTNFTDEEIETVLAHELAHHVHKDIPLSILVNSLLIFASFFLASLGLVWGIELFHFSSIADIANLPWLEIIFGLVSLLVFPAQNLFSRILEKRADAFALQLAEKPAAFASALRKLTDQNLAELDPDPWIEFFMHSHPSLKKRIAMAEQWVQPANE